LAEKLGKKITVYQNRRYDSDYKTVKKVLEEHWLGDIVEAEIHFDRYSETLSPKLHKETPGPGTGLLYDLGSHLIDQALQLFGMPDSVFADITIIRPISKVEDYMEILLYYTGLRVRIKSSYLVREALPAYILHGSKGSFIKPRADVQEQELLAGARPGGEDWGKEPEENDKWIKGLLHTEKDGKIIREYIPSLKGNYGAFYDGLYESIRNDRPLPVSPRDGINILRIIEASYESKRQKKIISL
jgi:predicted dehydrogenase